MTTVTLKGIRKTFGNVEALRGIELEIADNEFLVLVGPSGCGKSTTLRVIAGLEEVSNGEIYIGERLVNEVPPKDRDIAMVFQNYALYPHMTVFENMSFGLRMRRYPRRQIAERVRVTADILGISDLLDRRPKQLSGGQRQRVAMGRAIVRNPQVFLFDEPLSNLDANLRVKMRTEIKRIHQKISTTIIYVTHDQVEAMTMADRIAVMNQGIIEQIGTPADVYERPATKFVAGFIGSPAMNFIPCRLDEQENGLVLRVTNDLALKVPSGRSNRYKPHVGRELLLGLRPEHITDRRANAKRSSMVEFDAKIDVIEPRGVDTMVYFNIKGQDICARVDPGCVKGVGRSLPLTAHMSNMHLIDPDTERVI